MTHKGAEPLDPKAKQLAWDDMTQFDLTDDQRAEAGEFLQALEDHDDVHRVWAAIQ